MKICLTHLLWKMNCSYQMLISTRRNLDYGHISPHWVYKTPIDFILVRKKWRNSIKNSCAYNSFTSVSSDHRIVTAKVQLSMRSSGKTPPRKYKYNWKLFAQDTQLQDLYSVKVQNKFSALRQDCEENATSVYECFIKANRETTEELIPKAP